MFSEILFGFKVKRVPQSVLLSFELLFCKSTALLAHPLQTCQLNLKLQLIIITFQDSSGKNRDVPVPGDGGSYGNISGICHTFNLEFLRRLSRGAFSESLVSPGCFWVSDYGIRLRLFLGKELLLQGYAFQVSLNKINDGQTLGSDYCKNNNYDYFSKFSNSTWLCWDLVELHFSEYISFNFRYDFIYNDLVRNVKVVNFAPDLFFHSSILIYQRLGVILYYFLK